MWELAMRAAFPYLEVNCSKGWPTMTQLTAAHARKQVTMGATRITASVRPDHTRERRSPGLRVKDTQQTNGAASNAAATGSLRSR